MKWDFARLWLWSCIIICLWYSDKEVRGIHVKREAQWFLFHIYVANSLLRVDDSLFRTSRLRFFAQRLTLLTEILIPSSNYSRFYFTSLPFRLLHCSSISMLYDVCSIERVTGNVRSNLLSGSRAATINDAYAKARHWTRTWVISVDAWYTVLNWAPVVSRRFCKCLRGTFPRIWA